MAIQDVLRKAAGRRRAVAMVPRSAAVRAEWMARLIARRAEPVLERGVWAKLKRCGLLLLAVLAATQFVGAYLFLEWPYLNIRLWEQGYAPLPFQTRILLAPLYRLVDTSWWGIWYADRLSRNDYFFPHGVTPAEVLEFYIGIGCVLFSGWVAVRLYGAASRVRLLPWLVYPVFLGLCCVTYVLHTVQNFSYVYDMPSLAAFALGFYLIYFRKRFVWFALLFAIATLNRETTLLLLPFWALSQCLEANGTVGWRSLLRWRVWLPMAALGLYWLVWHKVVYAMFATNASEYYVRPLYNLKFFVRLRYWPQLASAFAYLWPFLIVYRRQIRDAQLRAWMMVLPGWYCLMMLWGVITETRVFGETLPMLAPIAVILAEELLVKHVLVRLQPMEEELVPAVAQRVDERFTASEERSA